MKGYFFLLALLYIATMVMNIWSLTHSIPMLMALKNALDIVLFSLCLFGAYGLGFKREYWVPARWRMTYQATLALGVFSVILMGFGERFGMPTPYTEPGIIQLVLMYLPYLLFALPVILYDNTLRKGFQE